jgi:cyclopropane-fatty-acyl-phospholipid synthase
MEQLIPRTLRRWESYQSNLAKSAVFSQFQSMTKGHIELRLKNDPTTYSFGYGKKVRGFMEIENERFFSRFWSNGELGFGESYVDGDWNSPELSKVIGWFFLNVDKVDAFVHPEEVDNSFMQFMLGLRYIQTVINHNKTLPSMGNWASRYELERPFFELMLDSSLTNSGAIFEQSESLEAAQKRKRDTIASELQIKTGSRILELGCGWGSFALYLATHYDCHVTAVTLSEEQSEYLKLRVKQLGISDRVDVLYADYRNVTGLFDRIVSIELIDTIEASQLKNFFSLCDRWLKPQGIMVHQLLLTPEAYRHDLLQRNEWNQKYISPGILTPSLSALVSAMSETSSFCIRNLSDIGLSYSKTLEAWTSNFKENIQRVRSLGFDEAFIRGWQYYLAYAEAAFDHGLLTAAQITITRATERSEERGRFESATATQTRLSR